MSSNPDTNGKTWADVIIMNGRIATQDERRSFASAAAIKDGCFIAVGAGTEFQFAERRMPTLDEINTVAPDTPVFVLHLYDRALLNAAALRAVGYTKDTPEPPGGEIRRDHAGNPTGLLIARPNAMIL